jgi:CubicO group peptidase (beta-lactamase class C family)
VSPSIFLALSLLLLLLGLAPTAPAQTSAPAAVEAASALEARIERIAHGLLPFVRVKGAPPHIMTLAERMERYKVPGVSIAVIHDSRIDWARGFGVARVDGAPVTPPTLFQAGSISKPVAAMGALKMVEQGRLSLDADVNRYLTSWRIPENEFTRDKKVTLRALLTHSAGLTVHGFPGYAATETVPTLAQVLNGVKPANTAPIRVDGVPGTTWRYSGGGFTVMQQLMVDVARRPFPDLMRELVLEPLAMGDSTYRQPLPPEFLAHAATPYYQNLRAVPGGPHVYPEMAAAGLWTTASDLARFVHAVQDGLAGTRNPVLSQAMLREMTRRQVENWGLGLGVDGEGDSASFAHNGIDAGFDAFLHGYVRGGNGVVVLCNANGAGALANEIRRAVAREYGWPTFQQEERTTVVVAPEVLRRYAGTYDVGQRKLVVRATQGTLSITSEDLEIELFASTPNRFFGVDQGTWYEFAPAAPGGMELTVTPGRGGAARKGKRIN